MMIRQKALLFARDRRERASPRAARQTPNCQRALCAGNCMRCVAAHGILAVNTIVL